MKNFKSQNLEGVASFRITPAYDESPRNFQNKVRLQLELFLPESQIEETEDPSVLILRDASKAKLFDLQLRCANAVNKQSCPEVQTNPIRRFGFQLDLLTEEEINALPSSPSEKRRV